MSQLSGFAKLAFAAGAVALSAPSLAAGGQDSSLVRICSAGGVRFVRFGTDDQVGSEKTPEQPGAPAACHALATLRDAEKRPVKQTA